MLWRGSDGAYCGTVGSRTSRSYVRLYDKGVESQTEPPGVYWRYEVEAKRDLAGSLWKELKEAADPTSYCQSVCERSARSLGLRWPSTLRPDLKPMPPVPKIEPADVTRTLAWLRKTVRPSILRLREAVGDDALLSALGFLPERDVRQPPEE